MTWARRLKRGFSIEIEQCVRCGGRLKAISSIEEPELIERILAHRRERGARMCRRSRSRWQLATIDRTLDYLETRADIDAECIGYAGLSFGSTFPLHLVAVESRFRAALMLEGALLSELPPLVDPVNYAARIEIPLLMITGRYDYVNPIETQEALFELFGTPLIRRSAWSSTRDTSCPAATCYENHSAGSTRISGVSARRTRSTHDG
jgi:pimeloyl-ACP methyl ester carboxylesterase